MYVYIYRESELGMLGSQIKWSIDNPNVITYHDGYHFANMKMMRHVYDWDAVDV